MTTSFSESDLYMCLHEDAREKSFHIIGEDITITKINDINYGFILHTGIGPFSEMGGFFKKYWDKPSPPSITGVWKKTIKFLYTCRHMLGDSRQSKCKAQEE